MIFFGHWQLKLSPAKCCALCIVLHVSPHCMTDRTVSDYFIGTVTDWGVTYDRKLSHASHIDTIVAKASLRSTLILRCFQSRDSGLLMHASITFVRPILEYFTVVWRPAFKDIVRTEAVQRRFTKKLSGFSNLSHEERLASLNCESLYSRRIKCDFVMCYQMLSGSVNIDNNAFFTCSYHSTTRGNSMKLFKPQFTSVQDGNFFIKSRY